VKRKAAYSFFILASLLDGNNERYVPALIVAAQFCTFPKMEKQELGQLDTIKKLFQDDATATMVAVIRVKGATVQCSIQRHVMTAWGQTPK
jgi:hypothetical protein